MKGSIIVTSFGTSFRETLDKTIGAIEEEIKEVFQDEWNVQRAFTSNMIIKKIRERDGEHIDTLLEALKRAKDNGFKNVIIQPTHFMRGKEYEKIKAARENFKDDFDSIKIGAPLLYNGNEYDFAPVIEAVTKEIDIRDAAVVLMGHGTEANANEVYQRMDALFKDMGYQNFFVGTVEASPCLKDVVSSVKNAGYKKVVLAPLMVVAGDHAINDMAGDDEDSWKNVFKREGFEVDLHLRGLGENKFIREIYINHIKNMI